MRSLPEVKPAAWLLIVCLAAVGAWCLLFWAGTALGFIANNHGNYSVVYITAPTKDAAERLANALVTERLAACVNILPGVTSVYRWQGDVHKDPETLMIVKTRSALVQTLASYVVARHPYQTPEVLAVPVTGGLPKYLEWLNWATGGMATVPKI